jgi:hypothetical protein
MWGLIWEQISVALAYVIAAVLVAGGGYVAFALGLNPLNPLSKPLHYVGIILMVAGALLAWGTYEKSVGAADCEARWKAANYQAQIDKAQRELKIAQDSAAAAQVQADEMQQQTDAAEQRASDYEKTLANRPACNLTGDDLERLRSIR